MPTVNVPDDVLRKAMADAQTESAEKAVIRALEEFSRCRGQVGLIKYLGTFQDFMTPEELQQMREMDRPQLWSVED